MQCVDIITAFPVGLYCQYFTIIILGEVTYLLEIEITYNIIKSFSFQLHYNIWYW